VQNISAWTHRLILKGVKAGTNKIPRQMTVSGQADDDSMILDIYFRQ
jgi:hypothetical protein